MSNTSSSVLNVRIPTDLKVRLNNLAEQTDRSVAYYVKKVLEQNIADLEHAHELHSRAQSAREGTAHLYTADELRAELGL